MSEMTFIIVSSLFTGAFNTWLFMVRTKPYELWVIKAKLSGIGSYFFVITRGIRSKRIKVETDAFSKFNIGDTLTY